MTDSRNICKALVSPLPSGALPMWKTQTSGFRVSFLRNYRIR